jgi:TonB-dependent SusC/RagA subfamily outer membrane receptor
MFIAGLALAAPRAARAQDNSISGRVVAAGSNEGLAGAQITVSGGTQRAASDADGRFRITGLTGTDVRLDVRRIGYRTLQVPARVGATNLLISLTSNPTSLEAVVVTGTVGASQKREIGNAVGTINASEIAATAPVINMQGLLNGRSPSIVVMPTSGQVGTGSQIRIRGQGSLSLGNYPLIFVDGVRVNNDPATGPVSQAFGSSPISRLNDFNPDDIESIEVLKGPSASTLYGTEAANGVINIITKKGVSTVPRWNVTSRQGWNYFADYKSRFPVNYGARRLATDAPSANPSGPVEAVNFDSLLIGACGDSIATRLGKKCDIFRTGRHQETDLAVQDGHDRRERRVRHRPDEPSVRRRLRRLHVDDTLGDAEQLQPLEPPRLPQQPPLPVRPDGRALAGRGSHDGQRSHRTSADVVAVAAPHARRRRHARRQQRVRSARRLAPVARLPRHQRT